MASKPQPPPTVAFYAIAVVVAVFVMLGLVMVLSASSINQFHQGHSPYRIFNKQVMWAVLGAGRPVDRRCACRTTSGAASSCRLAVVVRDDAAAVHARHRRPRQRRQRLGRHRSAVVAAVGVPEAVGPAVLRQPAGQTARRDGRPIAHAGSGAWSSPIVGAGLCLVQSDLGSAIVLASIVFVVAFIAGAPLRPMAAAAALGAVGALAFVVSSPRRQARFTAFLDIAAHKDHLSYQTYQAMIALAQGGLAGEGVGQGKNKLGDFLPLAHSDFIFAVVAEELGMIGVVAVLGGFLILAYAGVQVALATQDRFASLLAGGIVIWFVVQTIINVGGVTGMMPVTGLDAAVLLRRRQFAVRHDDRGRAAAQRGSQREVTVS